MNWNKKIKSSAFTDKVKIAMPWLISAIIGTLACFYLYYLFNKCPYTWDETSCEIISSELIELAPKESAYLPADYEFKIVYHYRYRNKDYTCKQFASINVIKTNKLLRRWAREYLTGSKTKCHVNPNNPNNAVIYREFDWFELLNAFVVVIFTALVSIKTYFARKRTQSNGVVAMQQTPASYCWMAAMASSIFLIIGCGLGWSMFGEPLFKAIESKKWEKTSCKIVINKLRIDHSGENVTSNIDIAFKYKFNGVEYIGDSYNFDNGYKNASVDNSGPKRKIINHYPIGTITDCYVNPEEPREAVISRKISLPWWILPLPIIFVLLGMAGVIISLRQRKKLEKSKVQSESIRGSHLFFMLF